MADRPKTSFVATEAGISPSYASEILNGKRTPPRNLAIHILRKTSWRHEMLDGLTDEQIEVLEQVDPWQPPNAEAA